MNTPVTMELVRTTPNYHCYKGRNEAGEWLTIYIPKGFHSGETRLCGFGGIDVPLCRPPLEHYSPEDEYVQLAASIYDIPAECVTRSQRERAKTIGFFQRYKACERNFRIAETVSGRFSSRPIDKTHILLEQQTALLRDIRSLLIPATVKKEAKKSRKPAKRRKH